MKKTILFLAMLLMTTVASAQTLLKGDMDHDGKITLSDLTAIANVIVGKAPVEAINVFEVDNSSVIGTWYATDGTTLIFRADGTTNHPGGATYEFMPILGNLLVYDATGGVVKSMTFKNVTPEYLLEENSINGALTYYTNSSCVVTDITLSRTSMSLNSGSTSMLQATVAPLTALNKGVAWSSSDENVATVDDNGWVTAVAAGTCDIICTAKDGGGASAACAVTVIQLVTGLTLSQTSLPLTTGSSQTLTATAEPSNASNQSVTWSSSDTDVATVSQSGLVTAVGVGSCTITATSADGSGKTATCAVIVTQLVTNITLSQTSLSLTTGNSQTLTATAEPSNASDKSVTWSSSDTDVATVSQSGVVTAVGAGTCTITCTATDGGGASTTCEVTVIQLVTSITLSDTVLALELDGYKRLTATVLPENASNKRVTWSSSDESVAEVTGTGGVAAVGLGTCTITCSATDGSGVSATCTVNVVLQPVTDITLSSSNINMTNISETHQLTATVTPTDADIPNVTWTSSDETVATVDQTGLVTSIAEGTCTITASATDGSGVSAICTVAVFIDLSGSIDGKDYVDLGLPSGTLWATCNVGADNPEDYGDYFAWGETTGYNNGKTNFSWSTYKYCNGSEHTLTKYCNDSSFGNNGFTDSLTELLPEDDAATANWGQYWCMPTQAQLEELINSSYTTSTWTTQNGKNGYIITSKKNGNSIFLPAAGYRNNTSLIMGSNGSYSSRTLSMDVPVDGWKLELGSGNYGVFTNHHYRYVGRSVRPVRSVLPRLTITAGYTHQLTLTATPENVSIAYVMWQSSDESVATVDTNGLVTGISKGMCTITASTTDGSSVLVTYIVAVFMDLSGSIDGKEYVDLCLPSHTLWATCNVGADSPEGYGDYFAWGETEPKEDYSWSTYKYCNGSRQTLTKYCNDSSFGNNGFTDSLTELLPEDDAATANWGQNWCMPTHAQLEELINSSYTTSTWTTQNGVNGLLITSKRSGNSLFLPAAGQYSTNLVQTGLRGLYRARTLYTDPCYARDLYFDSGIGTGYELRFYGRSVRPVRVSQ